MKIIAIISVRIKYNHMVPNEIQFCLNTCEIRMIMSFVCPQESPSSGISL